MVYVKAMFSLMAAFVMTVNSTEMKEPTTRSHAHLQTTPPSLHTSSNPPPTSPKPLQPPPPTPSPPFNITESYSVALDFTRRFLQHTMTRPHNMTLSDLQKHLKVFFGVFDPTVEVRQLVGARVGGVQDLTHAHALYILLDLFSALELRRFQYMSEVMTRFQEEVTLTPVIPGRHINPMYFIIQGFTRHVRRLRREGTQVYREILTPRPDNIYFIANFQPGGQLALQTVMEDFSIDSPFLHMDDRWYNLRPADHPTLQLTIRKDNQLWIPYFTNLTGEPSVHEDARPSELTTQTPVEPSAMNSAGGVMKDPPGEGLSSTHFLFLPNDGNFGAIHYRLVSADLADDVQIVVPDCLFDARRTKKAVFSAKRKDKNGRGFDVIKLSAIHSHAHILTHKSDGCILFLSFEEKDGHPDLVLTPKYPGSSSHWLVVPVMASRHEEEGW